MKTGMYEFAAIIQRGETQDDYRLPKVTADGALELAPGEQVLTAVTARSLALYRRTPQSTKCYFNLPKASIQVTLTSARVLVLCRKFEKGNTWWGNIFIAIPATIFSRARVAIRRHGKVLAGHMHLTWIREISCAHKPGWAGPNWLRLSAWDEDGAVITAQLGLERSSSARALAEQILTTASALQLSHNPQLSDDDRDTLHAGLTLPPQAGDKPTAVVIPGVRPVAAPTAQPAQAVR